MTKKMKWLPLLLGVVLLLAACGQKVKVTVPETPPQPVSNGQQAPEEKKLEVENSGGYYVRVNDKVYFRRYGKDALGKVATFGTFAGDWGISCDESELVAYDTASGKLETLFVENGCGPLWYGDGGFYLRECDGVSWYALDGSAAEQICAGRPLYVTENGLLAAVQTNYSDEYQATYTFYRDKKLVGKAETGDVLYEAGLTEQGLFLIGGSGGYADDTVYVRQITPDGKILNLGELPETDGDASYYGMQADRFLDMGDKVVIGVGYYAGTGYFLNEEQFVEVTPGQENSLRELEYREDAAEEDDEPEWELPYPVRGDDGTLAFVPALPGALRVGWEDEDKGALEVYENGAWRVLAENFCPDAPDGYGRRRIEQHMEYINGTAYVTLAYTHASPVDSVGWRDAFALLDMAYLAVDGGAVRELDCVEYDTELYGDVWFVEGASTLLWRQVSDDPENDNELSYVYAVPIAEDAYWEGGWEAVWDGTTGLLPYDYGEGEESYYGIPAPEDEPAGRLCLRLDRDGTVVALSRKAPNELLAVDFDVAEGELAGAAEKLALERRDDDEDTLWFWTKLRALEDGVRVRVERTPDDPSDVEQVAMIEGGFAAGETLCDRVLNRGEFIALRASLPWHPELRVSVSKDGAWGAYVFGEDNWMHLWTEDSVHPELKLAASPTSAAWDDYTGEKLRAALDGTWLYRSPLSGEYISDFTFNAEEGRLYAGEDGCDFAWSLERLYAGEYRTPDLLCLRVDNEYTAGLLGGSGRSFGFTDSAGDYLIELYQTDGEEILRLTQANNGDGYLGVALQAPEGRDTYSFTLTRARGCGAAGARRRSATFPAVAARWDRDDGILWLQEAEQVDELEDGSPVYRAVPSAPCLAYPIGGSDVAQALTGGGDDAHPLVLLSVTVDRDGTVTRVEPLGV